jgi:hypothetical protein
VVHRSRVFHDGRVSLTAPDPDPVDWLRHARAAPVPSDPPTPECLDEDTIGAFAEGTLDHVARTAALPHVAACTRCRSALASVTRALADRDVGREATALEKAPARPRWRRYVVPAAAAAVLLVLLGPLEVFRPGRGAGHRAPTIANGSLPNAIAPKGVVAEVHELRWTPVEGADRYRVILFAADGRAVYEGEPLATEAQLPDSVVLAPGERYLWRVEARVGFDRWVSSEFVEFSLPGRITR